MQDTYDAWCHGANFKGLCSSITMALSSCVSDWIFHRMPKLPSCRFPLETFHISGISKFTLKISCSTISENVFRNRDPNILSFISHYFSFQIELESSITLLLFLPYPPTVHRDGPDWGDKGIKKGQTHKCLGSGEWDLWQSNCSTLRAQHIFIEIWT